MKKALLLTGAMLLGACSSQPGTYQDYLAGRGLGEQSPELFQQCHAYGCKVVDQVALSPKQWKTIEKTFRPKPTSAHAERKALAKAIGAFETEVGPMTGTDTDVYGTFVQMGRDQLDCVDESTNTTIYLSLLEEKGLMRFHETLGPTSRLPLIHYAGRWPHQTAVIREKGSGALFAVDSWFHNNGAPAEVVPLQDWKDGWKPAERHGSFY